MTAAIRWYLLGCSNPQRSETCANFFGKKLRLFPRCEVTAFRELVEVDEFRICLLCPTPRSRIEFVRNDAYCLLN
jgi:hypothetical protein